MGVCGAVHADAAGAGKSHCSKAGKCHGHVGSHRWLPYGEVVVLVWPKDGCDERDSTRTFAQGEELLCVRGLDLGGAH